MLVLSNQFQETTRIVDRLTKQNCLIDACNTTVQKERKKDEASQKFIQMQTS